MDSCWTLERQLRLVIALKWKKTRDQDVDLWSFYIRINDGYAVPLKKGSPQEIRINPDFNELLAT